VNLLRLRPVALVGALSAVAVAVFCGAMTATGSTPWQWPISLLVAATCMTETFPVAFGRQRNRSGAGSQLLITMSTVPGLTVGFLLGPVACCAVFVVSLAVASIFDRTKLRVAAINVVNVSLSSLAASFVIRAFLGSWRVDARSLPGADLAIIGTAAAVFLLMNTVLLSFSMAVTRECPFRETMREVLIPPFYANCVIIAAVPAVMAIATNAPTLILLLLVPVAVAQRNMQMSVESDRQARHDALTGLPNRLALNLALSQWLDDGRVGHMVLLDIDRFNDVNNVLGLEAGDRLLQKIATRLTQLATDSANGEVAIAGALLTTRTDGDNFGMLTECIDTEAIASVIAQVFAVPFEVDGQRIELQPSIGMTPLAGRDPNNVLRQAEVAKKSAKQRPEHYAVHALSMESGDPARLGLLADFRDALLRGDIEIALQPVTPLAANVPIGFEALARWTHPDRGEISPAVFIPIAEQSGLIRELTDLILDRALAACRVLHNQGWTVSVAVNVSPRTLHDPMLGERIAELLAKHDVAARSLVLEVTESAVMIDPERATASLLEIGSRGVGIALDDYGTGFSSLSLLSTLPIQVLKIDKSFITTMTPGSRNEMIAFSTIEMAHRMGLRVIAEGVETTEVWEMLERMGCDAAQGYFVRRPGSLAEVLTWLDARLTRMVSELSAGE
jgi:diguanylate cyclase (GGDEF)-like protein